MAQDYSAAKIADELGRGFAAAEVKAHKLGLSLRLKHPRERRSIHSDSSGSKA